MAAVYPRSVSWLVAGRLIGLVGDRGEATVRAWRASPPARPSAQAGDDIGPRRAAGSASYQSLPRSLCSWASTAWRMASGVVG